MMASAATARIPNEAAAAAPNPQPAAPEEDERWKRVMALPCELTVELPLPDFNISDFLKLRVASLIDARWRLGRDVPLRLNGTLIGWVEFEISGDHLAVRLTEIA
jgi:flagellar motor switch/type III secretory pathway protein FliN